MNERRSLQLLAEQYSHVQTNQILRDAFERDLKAFEQYLVQEGLWDTIKQKGSQLVGGAKNALIQPLIKMVLDKLAQSDPEGYKKLQAAANDPAQLQALLNSPEVQQQQQSLGQDVATTAEGLDEELYDEYLNEAYSYLVDEAWIDPKTGKFVAPGTPGAIERKSGAPLSQTPNAIKKRAARAAASGKAPASDQPTSDTPAAGALQGPGATLNTGQHGSTAAYAAARGGKVAGPAPQQPSNAVKAIGKAGDAASWLGKKAVSATQALGQTKAGQAVKSAAGGFIGKAVNWVKAHPKISLAAALGLIVATGGAAAIGAGGIAPLIATTLTAGGAGALKGGAIGAVAGGAKDIYNQVKGGDVKNLGDVKWGQAGKAALKTGVKGAAAGFAAGAGANILGKAALGAKDVISGNYGKAMKGFGPDNALRDLTPGEQRNLGVTDNQPTAGNASAPKTPLSPDELDTIKNTMTPAQIDKHNLRLSKAYPEYRPRITGDELRAQGVSDVVASNSAVADQAKNAVSSVLDSGGLDNQGASGAAGSILRKFRSAGGYAGEGSSLTHNQALLNGMLLRGDDKEQIIKWLASLPQ